MSSDSQNKETIEELHEKLNEIGEEVKDEIGAAQLHEVLKSSGSEDDGSDEHGSVNQIKVHVYLQGTQNQELDIREQ